MTFKSNHRAYHLFDKDRNQLASLQKLHPWSKGEEAKLNNLVKRLLLIIHPHHKNDANFRVLVDAEQSYTQLAIESITE